MLLPFLVVGGLGLLLLVVSLVIGDVLDHFEMGDGLVSGTALGIGLTVFGAAGALTVGAGLDLVWAYVAAIVLAAAAYVASVLFVRSLARSSDGVPASAIGLTGVATASISSSGGEVSLDGPGELERRLAWADAPIAEGSRVRVIEHAGSRVKVVADHA
ncbi:NfeD family protein [Agromyces aurantiacus]|uniref:NfeD family protein n=1 Tax=Agromyces aurantiacus TaxID=165814 RepID=A0ABV9RB09_9MICO|nr:NfeD family protein [Agromyces aurantiacus]MBM7504689.1 membrane-bound ClpP family serine protease [Agromyces aurantiacus]